MLSITGLAWYAGIDPEGQRRSEIRELRRTLDKLGVGPDRYQNLDRWNPRDDTWCIKRQGKVWLVFYSE